MGDPPLWSHETQLTPQAISVSGARRFVRHHLLSHGLRLLVDDVELVVSELATNALAHAGTPFTVSLTGSHHTVIVEVRDDSSSGPYRVNSKVFDTAGRGVAIVELLSRDWGVTGYPGRGKSVWAQFDTQ